MTLSKTVRMARNIGCCVHDSMHIFLHRPASFLQWQLPERFVLLSVRILDVDDIALVVQQKHGGIMQVGLVEQIAGPGTEKSERA